MNRTAIRPGPRGHGDVGRPTPTGSTSPTRAARRTGMPMTLHATVAEGPPEAQRDARATTASIPTQILATHPIAAGLTGGAPYASTPASRRPESSSWGHVPIPPSQAHWLVGADGGIFAFGQALFYGSMGDAPHQPPS